MKVAAPPLGGTTKSPRRGSYKPSAEPVVMTFAHKAPSNLHEYSTISSDNQRQTAT